MSAHVPADLDARVRATRRVARNTAFLALAEGANKLMLFFFNMTAARHLGVEHFGVFSFALAFVTMLAVFTDLGLGVTTAREIARDPASARRYVSNALAIRLLASVLVIVLIGVLVNVMGYPAATTRVVYICSFFVIESAVTSYYCWVFQGFERMELAAASRVIQTVMLAGGAYLLSRHPAAVESYALLYVGAGLLSALFAATVASVHLVRPGLSFAPRTWWALLRPALPVGLTVVFTMFYYWNGTTLLSKLSGFEAVGNYASGFRLAMGFAFVGFAFSGAVFPLLSRLFVTNQQRLKLALELALKYVTLLVLPLALLLSAMARPIIQLVYGPAYEGGAVVLQVIAWWGALASLNSLLSNYLMAVDRPALVTAQSAVSLGINVLGNVLLIPPLGAVGAAVSIVCAEGVGFLWLFVRQSRTAGGAVASRYGLVLLRVAVALVPAMALARLSAKLGLAATFGLSVAAYLAVLLVTRGVDSHDLGLLRTLARGSDA